MATRTRKTWLATAVLAALVTAPGVWGAQRPVSTAQLRAQMELPLGSTVRPVSASSRRTGLWVLQARAQTERALGSTVNPALAIGRPNHSVARLRERMEGPLGSNVGIGLTPLAIAPAPVGGQGSGFDWGDASVGGGLVAALGLFAAAALVLIRRRGAPA